MDKKEKPKQETPKEEKEKNKKKTKYPEPRDNIIIIHDCVYPERPEAVLSMKDPAAKLERPIDTVRVELKKLRAMPNVRISGPESVMQYLKEMADYDREYVKIIHLDQKNRVIGLENISEGTISGAALHPREVVKGATLNNASGVIFVHNHPSGIPTPSREDTEFVKTLINAFSIMRIEVLDSIIIGKEGFYSHRAHGDLPRPSTEVSAVIEIEMHETKDEDCQIALRAAREVIDEQCTSKPKAGP